MNETLTPYTLLKIFLPEAGLLCHGAPIPLNPFLRSPHLALSRFRCCVRSSGTSRNRVAGTQGPQRSQSQNRPGTPTTWPGRGGGAETGDCKGRPSYRGGVGAAVPAWLCVGPARGNWKLGSGIHPLCPPRCGQLRLPHARPSSLDRKLRMVPPPEDPPPPAASG